MSKFDKAEVCPHCGVVLPAVKMNMCSRVVDVIRKRPDLSYAAIAKAFHISRITVARYAKRAGICRRKKQRSDLS